MSGPRAVFIRAQLVDQPGNAPTLLALPSADGVGGRQWATDRFDPGAILDVEVLQTTDGGVTGALAESLSVTSAGGFVYLRLHDRADRVFAVVMLSREEAVLAAERLLDAADDTRKPNLRVVQ